MSLLGGEVLVTDPMYWRSRQNAAEDLDLSWEETMQVDSGNMSPELAARVKGAQDARAIEWAEAVDASTLSASDALMHNAVLNGGKPTQAAIDASGLDPKYMTDWGVTGGHQNNELVTNVDGNSGVVNYNEGTTLSPSDAAQVGNYQVTESKGGNANAKRFALTGLAMFAGPVAGALTAPGAILAGTSTAVVQAGLTAAATTGIEGDLSQGLTAGAESLAMSTVMGYLDDRIAAATKGGSTASTSDILKDFLPEGMADTIGGFVDTNITPRVDAAGKWAMDLAEGASDKVSGITEYLDIATSPGSFIDTLEDGSTVVRESALPDWMTAALKPIKDAGGSLLDASGAFSLEAANAIQDGILNKGEGSPIASTLTGLLGPPTSSQSSPTQAVQPAVEPEQAVYDPNQEAQEPTQNNGLIFGGISAPPAQQEEQAMPAELNSDGNVFGSANYDPRLDPNYGRGGDQAAAYMGLGDEFKKEDGSWDFMAASKAAGELTREGQRGNGLIFGGTPQGNPPELQPQEGGDTQSGGVPTQAMLLAYLASQGYNPPNGGGGGGSLIPNQQGNSALWDVPGINPSTTQARPDYGPIDYGPELQPPSGGGSGAGGSGGGLIRPSAIPASNSGQPSWAKYQERYADPDYGGGKAFNEYAQIQEAMRQQGLLGQEQERGLI